MAEIPLDQKPVQAEIDDVMRYLRLAPELQNVVRRMIHDANGLAASNVRLEQESTDLRILLKDANTALDIASESARHETESECLVNGTTLAERVKDCLGEMQYCDHRTIVEHHLSVCYEATARLRAQLKDELGEDCDTIIDQAEEIERLKAENARLWAGYSPACEGCKQHSGHAGVHWCDECVSDLKQAVHAAQCEAARDFGENVSLRQKNARLREAFDRYTKREICVEYARGDTDKLAYWGYDVRYWDGVRMPKQAVGPYATCLEAALAVIAQETKHE